jgi:1-acyl-sn-glycerol-3-phosphate acyltransferase
MIFRSIWVGLNLFIATFSLSAIVVIAALFRHRGRFYEWVARTWARWTLWASGVRVRIEGLENLRADRPQIVASNHQSWFDVFAIAAFLPKRYRFIAKEELRRIPLFGLAWESAGHISINRQDRVRAITALDAAGALMRGDNSTVIIFPEGTRSRSGQLQPFKKGTFMLALRTGIEIVPTAVVGSRGVLKKGDWRVRRGPIIVRFGAPIDSSKYDESHREQLMGAVRERIERMLDHPERKRDGVDVRDPGH